MFKGTFSVAMYDIKDSDATTKYIECNIKKYAATNVIPANLDIRCDKSYMQEYLDFMIVTLINHVMSIESDESIKVPMDWWQHFKEKWFPKWAIKRWPISYKIYTAEALYPESLIKLTPEELGRGRYHFVVMENIR